MSASAQLILVAGGMGTRLGSDLPKALVALCGVPIFVRSLRAFEAAGFANNAVVVYPGGHESSFRAALDEFLPDSAVELIAGGEERYDSVRNGVAALDRSAEIVLIHDAARPFVQGEVITRAVDAAVDCGAATVATRCTDTILQGDGDGYLDSTPDRRLLWGCQTPQVFGRAIIEGAYRGEVPETLTDDATLVRGTGHRVRIVEGPDTNIKITTRQDLEYATFMINEGLV